MGVESTHAGGFVHHLDPQGRPSGSPQVLGAADEWLAWLTHQRRFTAFQTHLDEGEKHLGTKQLPVDGYNAATHTACKYHSCYWHGY